MEIFDHIAISSRIRLARNVRGIKFFAKLDSDSAEEIIIQVKGVLERFDLFNFMRLRNLSLNECHALFEQHLISREVIANKDISSVAISEDGNVIIMMNEEDHIREQCIEKGFNLLKPYKRLKKIDEDIIKNLDIAFDERWGFITASPSNLGSGMRASVMLFLPAMERAGKINNLFDEMGRLGLTIRGIYGEGSRAIGSYYQISNQNSLGKSEEEIIDEVSEQIYEICKEEAKLRSEYMLSDRAAIHDEALRAYGLLTNCYQLEEEEMMTLLSQVYFGASLGFLEILDEEKFQKLYHEGGSANLKEIFGFSGEKKENIVRAEYISNKVLSLVRRR